MAPWGPFLIIPIGGHVKHDTITPGRVAAALWVREHSSRRRDDFTLDDCAVFVGHKSLQGFVVYSADFVQSFCQSFDVLINIVLAFIFRQLLPILFAQPVATASKCRRLVI